jgi:hypothetical protein
MMKIWILSCSKNSRLKKKSIFKYQLKNVLILAQFLQFINNQRSSIHIYEKCFIIHIYYSFYLFLPL